VWLVATQRASWHDVFVAKPPHVRKILQEEITQLRYDFREEIWLETFCTWMCALKTIVGIEPAGIVVTDLRFLIEMRRIKLIGGKILHLEAIDQQANIAPELRGHRSETKLDSPEVQILRDTDMFNATDGIMPLTRQGNLVLLGWGWL
jgi:hypothetical protein